MKMNVILEKADSNWCAYTPDDGFCIVATGRTRDKVIEQFQGALFQHLEAMKSEGLEVPDVTELEIREVVPLSSQAA